MMGRSLVQKSPTDCGVSECELETSTMGRPAPSRAVAQQNISFKLNQFFVRHMSNEKEYV